MKKKSAVKIMERILASALSAALLATSVPITSFAYEQDTEMSEQEFSEEEEVLQEDIPAEEQTEALSNDDEGLTDTTTDDTGTAVEGPDIINSETQTEETVSENDIQTNEEPHDEYLPLDGDCNEGISNLSELTENMSEEELVYYTNPYSKVNDDLSVDFYTLDELMQMDLLSMSEADIEIFSFIHTEKIW